ncbi:MAG: bacteriocin immunity protein [Pseudomonas sp.]|nr:bacteriocin immunity protein [Pseudomonas sp.]
MVTKTAISDYTEIEFINFLREIEREGSISGTKKLQGMLNHFIAIVEHPKKTDLIYYASAEDSEPENVTKIIKDWLKENEKPDFKTA